MFGLMGNGGGQIRVRCARPSAWLYNPQTITWDAAMRLIGSIITLCFWLMLSAAAQAGDGSIDSTWAGGGRLQLDITPGVDYGNSILVQPDGKVLMAGTCGASPSYFCAVRLLPNGSYDTSYGPASHPGRVLLSELTSTSADFQALRDLALTPDGGSVLVGYASTAGAYSGEVFKLTSTGTVGGQITLNSSPSTFLLGVAVQPDGKLLVGGYVTDAAHHASAYAARILANLSGVDASFGSSGSTTVPLSSGVYINAVALQPDGKLLLAGITQASPVLPVIMRIQSNGLLDDDPVLGFGSNGRVEFDWSATAKNATPTSVKVDRDGSIVLGGYANNVVHSASSIDMFVDRLTASGAQSTFNQVCSPTCVSGPLLVGFNLGLPNDDYSYSLAIQPDGKIVLGGQAATGSSSNNYWGIARVTPAGTLDSDFGGGGISYASFGTTAARDNVYGIAVGNRGIMIAGTSQVGTDSFFGVARLTLDHIFGATFE